jgi:hypothetical protein
MDILYQKAKNPIYERCLKSIVNNITDVVKHSKVWSNYKLKDLMEVVFLVLKMLDTQMQDAGRKLEGQLKKNFEEFVLRIDLDRFFFFLIWIGLNPNWSSL